MRTMLLLIAAMVVTTTSFSQIAYLQYRTVPEDREGEFVEKETKYWAKVAKAAVDQGNLSTWSLWRKIGVTEAEAPNYVFVNTYESIEKMDPSKVWSEENIKKMGVSPDTVETNSFAPVAFDYWMQLEDMIQGDYKYAIVNYAMPSDMGAFIEENKALWKPLHQKNITNESNGMTSWGLMSVIHPGGNEARFSVLTWDGFNSMADVFNYLRYQNNPSNTDWNEVISKSKMGEIMPEGFEYSIVYELVEQVAPEN